MKPNSDFKKLLKNPLFASHLVSVIIDKAHCITKWGEFRPEYQELGRLHYILPSTASIMITSTTLTKASLTSTTWLLHMHADRMVTIHRSSDNPNIKIRVKKIKHALNSYADLMFLFWQAGRLVIPQWRSSWFSLTAFRIQLMWLCTCTNACWLTCNIRLSGSMRTWQQGTKMWNSQTLYQERHGAIAQQIHLEW